jgi:hypothetical protein
VWDCVFSVDAAYLVTASSDATARLWELSTGERFCVLCFWRWWLPRGGRPRAAGRPCARCCRDVAAAAGGLLAQRKPPSKRRSNAIQTATQARPSARTAATTRPSRAARSTTARSMGGTRTLDALAGGAHA